MDKTAGILFAISSLPSKYGIGCFSKEAYKFVDWLEEAGQTYWQILPLGVTGFGDSPYQSFSTFAGNPYFIDLEALISEGLITEEECNSVDFGSDEQQIDYEKLYNGRYGLLRKAYERSNVSEKADFVKFLDENKAWIYDYSLFMAIKNHFGGIIWTEWPEDIRTRSEEAVKKYQELLADDMTFQQYMQYLFFKQWKMLREYTNKKGIQIIGDIPIYVALDSSDAWASPELFQLDEDCMPIAVAGCPPDGFSADGQLWGNPLYDWKYHAETGYTWWIERLSFSFGLYDVLRIDHFRGFDEYYSIPYGEKTAVNGQWEKGPGIDLFKAVEKAIGKQPVIAEDLGFMTDTVIELVEQTGFPGMKVLQFAFDSREESDYLPHNYTNNSIVYTGTHDNDTVVGWWETCSKNDKAFAKRYLNVKSTKDIHKALIRACLASVSDTAIIPMQDYLGLGSEARINIPSTLGNNWKWRLKDGQFTEELADEIYDLTKLYYRV
mgnify:CR=1 FL=1